MEDALPEKYAAYLDLPQNFDPEVGGRFYAGELRRIACELAKRGAQTAPTPRRSARPSSREDRRRASSRRSTPSGARSPRACALEAYLALRAGAGLTAESTSGSGATSPAKARSGSARVLDNVRVLVVGAFCEQPPFELIVALEKAGCDIVDDDFQLGLR